MIISLDRLTLIIKENTKKPILTCGAISSVKQINSISKQGAKLFAFGRAMLANKYFLKDIKKKKEFKNSFKYEMWKYYK